MQLGRAAVSPALRAVAQHAVVLESQAPTDDRGLLGFLEVAHNSFVYGGARAGLQYGVGIRVHVVLGQGSGQAEGNCPGKGQSGTQGVSPLYLDHHLYVGVYLAFQLHPARLVEANFF